MNLRAANMANSVSMDALLEPPTGSVRPYPHPHPHHCTDLALQKYLLLHEQHESLRQHLDELRPPTRQSSLYTPVSPGSPAGSLTRRSLSPDAPHRQPPQHSFTLPARKGSYPSSASNQRQHNNPEEGSPLAEVALEEAKLCGVTEGMKRALTELLNCEPVRGDMAFRTWVQCRLMDTERELRSGRRRRSAPSCP